MAEEFAQELLSNLAETLIDKLGSTATQEAGQWGGAGDDLESLKDTVSSIQATIMDLQKQQPRTHQVEDWLSKLREVMSEADALVEEVHGDAARRAGGGGGGCVGWARVFFSKDNQVVYGVRLRGRVKRIRQKIDQIANDRVNFQLQV